MTDSMNFGPEWLRNLSSEGSTAGNAGGGGGGTRYQLAEYRYGREEMLALFEKGTKAPQSLTSFAPLYSEQVLPPLALLPHGDEERGWQLRSVPPVGVIRGRGGSLERGGRVNRGRGAYQSYGRGYDNNGGGGWNVGAEPTEWSPRKDFTRGSSVDNWRKSRTTGEDDDGWRSNAHNRPPLEKWGRSTSWRDGGDGMEDRGAPERNNRTSWQEGMRGGSHRRAWDGEDHLPEWAMENPSESGGTFDASGAFHGSDEEQREHKHVHKKDVPLQKSVSQQIITTKSHPATLSTSQSTLSLSKSTENDIRLPQSEPPHKEEPKQLETKQTTEAKKVENKIDSKIKESVKELKREHKEQICDKRNDVNHSINTLNLNGTEDLDMNNKVEEEFQRMQEDIVKKLVVDEEAPRKMIENFSISSNVVNTTLPPPNLVQPLQQDKWYYQDPQGELQGPFSPSEMGEWFRAGYFTSNLLVKRMSDDSFYRLGELVALCTGNPFQTNIRIPPLKPDISNIDPELIQLQILQRQLALNRQQTTSMRVLNHPPEPWNNIPNIQQRELIAQQVLTHSQFLQQQQQPPPPPTNPLMQMISQMQQANKLPPTNLAEKNPTALTQQLDPIQALVQQIGMQNQSNIPGLPTTTVPSSVVLPGGLQNTNLMNSYQNLSSGLAANVPIGLQNASGLLVGGNLNNSGGIPNLSNSGLLPGNETLNGQGMPVSAPLTNNGLPVNLQAGLPNSISSTLPPRPNPLGAVDPSSANDTEALKNLFLQLANKHQQSPQLDSLWQQNQFTNSSTNKPQWQQPPSSDVPMSLWEFQSSAVATNVSNPLPQDKTVINAEQVKIHEKERQKQIKDKQEKEILKKKLEEKQAKREAEEKRKEEQKRQELERKAAEEKRKKEEEKIRKELEKAKKEADEKRLRELEEKRRLKEQRKAEEEARKKSEEQRRLEEERLRREAREREEQLQRQAEAAAREELNLKAVKIAPWSQANCTTELSLAEIQKAEREKRAAEQAALLQQHRSQQMLQDQQVMTEKQTVQLNWAKKPPETRKVKSFAEIQQEEQEKFAKQTAEARLAQNKEKEIINSAPIQTLPWSGQNLTWASAANVASQWNNGGFWEETSTQKPQNKSIPVSKSSSASAVSSVKPLVKPNKSKTKKEEQQVLKIFSNGPTTDEFTEWCMMALSKITNTVDIPTFISFLRDIESALEIREYCREYLGEGPSTHQFAAQFLEKRRMMKPKVVTQKDDMSSPAPAITPSSQHNVEFQEVKGKGKKIKKSKMTKVDARNLGFSVTAATDRINVGDRDYVEN